MKVAVGLSGGVDSAVSALLLKRAGFDVVGVHLYCWPPKSEYLDRSSWIVDGREEERLRKEWIKKNGCRADEDRASALKTALEIGIPFKTLDFSDEYNQRVIKYFYEEYEAGRTPNPDVLCNSEIKFGLFLSWALENGFEAIATGHYAKNQNSNLIANDHNPLLATVGSNTPAEFARLNSQLEFPTSLEPSNSSFRSVAQRNDGLASNLSFLQISKDKHKDQTYFLWKLTEKELKYVLFPLGDLLKSEVREIAREAKLSVADKKDSQGICFVGNVEVREFLKRRLSEKAGEVINTKGEVIGKHKGIAFYTIGERGGWEMAPIAQKKIMESGEIKPLFVIDKYAKLNRLIVGEKNEVMGNKIEITSISLINQIKPLKVEEFLKNKVKTDDLLVRIRHGGELFKVKGVAVTEMGWELRTGKDIFGIASGQSAVFYSGTDECLGGGIIV